MKSMRLLHKAQYHEEEADSEGTWALSYGDMITLLLSFFVIFFTTDPKAQKVQKLNRFLSFELESTLPMSSAEKSLEGQEKEVIVMPHAKGKGTEATQNYPDLRDQVIQVHEVGQNIVITFKGKSFFNSGATQPHRQGRELLEAFAEKYLRFSGNYRLAVKGFTDNQAVKNNLRRPRAFKDNLELSALRSISAMRIIEKKGVPLNHMEIAGGGVLEMIDKVLPHKSALTKEELRTLSRTLVLVVSPIEESWL